MSLPFSPLFHQFLSQPKPQEEQENSLSRIKSHSITSLPILNKKKSEKLKIYMENVLKDKQSLEEQFNDNYQNFQHYFFDFSSKTDKERESLSKNYKKISNLLHSEYLTRTEIQKFVNEDLLPKKNLRIEQELKKIQRTKSFKNFKSKRKSNKIDQILFEMFLSRLKKVNTKKLEEIKKTKEFLRHENWLNRILEKKFQEIYKKKIEYRTPSIIKSNNRISLGYYKVKLAFIPGNKLFKVFYCLDYLEKDENGKIKKRYMNIPMAYNPKYHSEYYLRSLGENKFKKGSPLETDEEYLEKMFHKENLPEKLQNAQAIYVREHYISLTEKGRLKIGLSYKEKINYKIKDISEENSLGIDLGGKIENALALSSNKFIPMEFLYGISEKLKNADEINDDEERNKKYREISKESKYKMNEFIGKTLNEFDSLKISHIVLEKLDPWNVKWRDKTLDMRANRVFRLLRSSGFANLVKIQARNRGMVVHTVPAYYTSQMCPECGHISRNNFQDNRIFKCEKCNHTADRDFNAARNLKLILLDSKRFLGEILIKDSFFTEEIKPKEYLKKEVVFRCYRKMKEAEGLNPSEENSNLQL